jgi:WD40 repeat protein
VADEKRPNDNGEKTGDTPLDDRTERIQHLTDETLERTAEERDAYLSEQCGDDVELRAEVEALIRHHQGPRIIAAMRGHEHEVSSVAFSPDGKRIASAARLTIKLWDATTGEEVATLHGHEWLVESVAFSPDGTHVASGSCEGTIKLWDAATGNETATLFQREVATLIPQYSVDEIAFSPDGTRLACAGGRTVRLLDVITGEEVATLRADDPISSIAFSPDGTRLATGELMPIDTQGPYITLWDTTTGQEIIRWLAHEEWLNSVAFSPDGTRLASGSDDGTVKLWDATTGKEIATLRGHEDEHHSCVAFSPDGTCLASAGDLIRLRDAVTGEEIATLRGECVNSVAFSPDGMLLASGSDDGTVRLWDAMPRREQKAELDQYKRALAFVTPRMDSMFADGIEPSQIAEQIRDDRSLTDMQRRAALNLILKRCSDMREQGADGDTGE